MSTFLLAFLFCVPVFILVLVLRGGFLCGW